MINHLPSVSLTGLGVHVSMNLCQFSNLRRQVLPLYNAVITFRIITKEAWHE
jgi:hypothetical protein